MSTEAFSNLIEIQGLLDKKNAHIQAILENQVRLDHLSKIQNKKKSESEEVGSKLAELSKTIQLNEKRIHDISTLLGKLKEDFYNLKTEKEVETHKSREQALLKENEEIENTTFSMLEQEEAFGEEIKDIKNFLQGFQKTWDEVLIEVNQANKKEEQSIEGYQLRIDALVSELPKDAFNSYQSAIKKYPQKFLSFVESIRCGVCRYEIERNTVALIDRAQVFELCGSCGRLLAPRHLPARL